MTDTLETPPQDVDETEQPAEAVESKVYDVDLVLSRNLRLLAARDNLTHADIATILSVTPYYARRRIVGEMPWLLGEALTIAAHFELHIDQLTTDLLAAAGL